MIEIEEDTVDDWVSIYVPRCAENMGVLKKLFALRASTADYWPTWEVYTQTKFTDNLHTYTKEQCVGHSWTFNSRAIAPRLRKIVQSHPVLDKTN